MCNVGLLRLAAQKQGAKAEDGTNCIGFDHKTNYTRPAIYCKYFFAAEKAEKKKVRYEIRISKYETDLNDQNAKFKNGRGIRFF